MKTKGLLPYIVGCVIIAFALSQENIFVGTRLDGSKIGPYYVKSLDRFHDLQTEDPETDEFIFSEFNLVDESNSEKLSGLPVWRKSAENEEANSPDEVNELPLTSFTELKNDSVLGVGDAWNKKYTDNFKNTDAVLKNLPSLRENVNVESSENVSRNVIDGNTREESIEYEIFPNLIDHDTNNVVLENPSAMQNGSSDIETITSRIIDTTTINPATSDSCHSACSAQLDKMVFKYTPKTSTLQSGDSLTLECSIPFEYESASRMIWLYQRVNPPTSQCSLTPQDTLTLCSEFVSVEHTVDTNFSAMIFAERILLSSLAPKDSGNYFCLVELTCCFPDPHIMQLILKTETPIKIYEENYALELGVLGGLVGCLVVILVIGTYLKKKRRRITHIPTSKIDCIPGVKDVLHAPILGSQGDSDSFDESDGEV